MALTGEQRREVSRKNGARSRGPKTEAGKRIASRNSFQHGLCSKATVLPNEDPAEVAALRDRWFDDNQPANAAEPKPDKR